MIRIYTVTLQRFRIQAELCCIPQPTRILTGLGFCFGVGRDSSSKHTHKIKKVWCAAEKGRAARSSKDRKTWHPNWNSCRRGIQFVLFICVSLYYRAKWVSSPFEIGKWVSHSFRAIHWLKRALAQKVIWRVTAHCILETASNLEKALWKQGKCSWKDLENSTSVYSNPSALEARAHNTGRSYKQLQKMKRWQKMDTFALKTLCWLLELFISNLFENSPVFSRSQISPLSYLQVPVSM